VCGRGLPKPYLAQASVTLEESIAGVGVGARLMDAYDVVRAVAQPLPPWFDAIGLGIDVAICPLGFRAAGGGASIETDIDDVGKQLLSMALPLVEATGTFLAARLPLLPGVASSFTSYAVCSSLK
jgi:hypothetical protein